MLGIDHVPQLLADVVDLGLDVAEEAAVADIDAMHVDRPVPFPDLVDQVGQAAVPARIAETGPQDEQFRSI